jgi:hypothetical protein
MKEEGCMKKLLLILMIFILPSLCFAISDITLFGGNEVELE